MLLSEAADRFRFTSSLPLRGLTLILSIEQVCHGAKLIVLFLGVDRLLIHYGPLLTPLLHQVIVHSIL